MTGETLESIVSAMHYLTAVLLGRDVADIEGALAATDGNARVPCHTLLCYMTAA
jgi:hypothetical protein